MIDAEAIWSPADGWRPGPWAITMADGRIGAIVPGSRGAGRVVTPTLANAHDHGRALSTLGAGIADAPLELWLPALFLHPHAPAELNATVVLGRMAAAGVGSVLLFDGQSPPDRLAERLAAIGRAARSVGLRVAVACSLRDTNRLAYDGGATALARLLPAVARQVRARWDVPAAPAAEQVAAAVAARATPGIDVQLAPVGPVWTSDTLLAEAARASAETGIRLHTHLLETAQQAAWARRTHPGGLLPHLDALGLLSPRLAAAHGVWLGPADRALLAARGVTVVLNISSNLRLGSGLPDAAALAAAGVALALGTDSAALDDDNDMWREWRLARVTQPGWRGADAAAFDAGHAVCGAPPGTGAIAVGAPADLCVLDLASLRGDALPHAPGLPLLHGRATAGLVREVWVEGRCITRDGRPTGIDLPAAEAELAAIYRALPEPPDSRLLHAWQHALALSYGLDAQGQAGPRPPGS